MKKNRITDYCVIDHIGSLDNGSLKKAYNKAYGLVDKGLKGITLKNLCKSINPHVQDLEGMKWAMRKSRNPKQVIIICTTDIPTASPDWGMSYEHPDCGYPLFNSYEDRRKTFFEHLPDKAQSIIKDWSEKTKNITLVHFEGGTGQCDVIQYKELFPECPDIRFAHMSKARRCAIIWANALDYTFDKPLWLTTLPEANDDKYIPTSSEDDDTKRYRKIAWDKARFEIEPEENVEFFYKNIYAYYRSHNLLKEFISSEYDLCPHCHRPVRKTAEQCEWCPTNNPNFVNLEFTRFYDDELDEEESWD